MSDRFRPNGNDKPSGNAPEGQADHPDERVPAESLEPTTLAEALERIAALRAEVVERDQENGELRDHLLRERAENENFKRRLQREKSDALRYASEPLLRDLLPVLDNLERALSAARAQKGAGPESGEALRTGVELVTRLFGEVLERSGVARIDAAGKPFDPKEHEALAHIETTLEEPGNVLDEHAPGYRLHDRLLRPAQVTVAKAPTLGR